MNEVFMSRRRIRFLLALAISRTPMAAMALRPCHIPRIGVLDPSSQQRPASYLPTERGDFGYVEGPNVLID